MEGIVFGAWGVTGFALIRLMVSFFNAFYRKTLDKKPVEGAELVDILIPARNEINNLPKILKDLQLQSYQKYNITVYDDNSEDGTSEFLVKQKKHNPKIDIVTGAGLPHGWSGKNHACFQLAKRAKGSIIIFLDADVRVGPEFIIRVVSHFRRQNLKLLSFFPVQVTKSWGEQLVVPLINWILLSLLPLNLVRKSSRSAFSAANGQCMVFDTENYLKHQWHRQVKLVPVEDIAIMKKMKQAGFTVETLLGSSEIRCRMYHSFRDSINGVARSAPAFFGNNWFFATFFVFVITLGPLLVLFTGDLFLMGLFGVSVILTRIFVAIASKQSVILSELLHIPQMIMLPLVVFKGLYARLKGRYNWKNRTLNY